MNWLVIVLVTVAALAVILVTIVTGVVVFKGHSLLHLWATRNHYRVVESDMRVWDRGPFLWTTNGFTQLVYLVTLQDAHGNTRKAWIAFGGRWLGPFSKKVRVKWEA
jgi:hypothetical protein